MAGCSKIIFLMMKYQSGVQRLKNLGVEGLGIVEGSEIR